MADTKEKLPPPEGTKPMMISMREMDTLGLKTGSGLRETVPYKILNKAQILEQISQIGFMCPFHEYRNEITRLQGDEILLIADPNETYGENWLLCLTRKALEAQLEILQQKEQADKERLEKEASGHGTEDDDVSKIVYEDKPIVPRPWDSSTSVESHDEVQGLTVQSSRPLIKISVTRMSDEFNADYKFSDRDADQCFVEWRQHKDPNYELTRMEQDIGLQGIPELIDGSTQTSWFRSVNSALQYEPIVMEPKRRHAELETDKMARFLEKTLVLVEEALQQNETLDIFLDPFANLNEEDSSMSSKSENGIKELRSFTDLVYSKNKTLPSIDWHPKKNGIVAVAAAANVSFMKRLDLLDKIDSSYILIWNFADLIHPQLMLEAPQDVLAMRFNPTMPHLIAGGLYNGQVIVWDYSKAEHLISKKKTKDSSSSASSKGAADESQKQIPPVKPLYISYIDCSHRRPVADLMWLPAGVEINNRGHLVSSSDPNVNQFVTIAGDGQVCFWDLRFKDPRYRGHLRTKMDKSLSKDAAPEVQFIPIYSIALTKVDSTGELGLKCFSFEKLKEDSNQTASSRFFCGTEEGEFVYADWRPHAVAKTSNFKEDDAPGNGEDGVQYVQWICRDHFRPIISCSASPFFPHIFLTVSESNFHLWNVLQNKQSETTSPIFFSPLSTSSLTCGVFSPTRPSVIYIGKADGMLEVWDFLDQSHRASLSVGVTACALTSLEFRPQIASATSAPAVGGASSAMGVKGVSDGAKGGGGSTNPSGANAHLNVKQQLLAVGDQNGNLHIMDIPRNLARASSGERQAMEAYFKRETDRLNATREMAALAAKANTSGTREEAVNNTISNGTGGTGGGRATEKAPVEFVLDEEMFKRMEFEFRKELGLEIAAA